MVGMRPYHTNPDALGHAYLPQPLVRTLRARSTSVRATENGRDVSPRRPQTNFNCR